MSVAPVNVTVVFSSDNEGGMPLAKLEPRVPRKTFWILAIARATAKAALSHMETKPIEMFLVCCQHARTRY